MATNNVDFFSGQWAATGPADVTASFSPDRVRASHLEEPINQVKIRSDAPETVCVGFAIRREAQGLYA
jgi:hypothetical protein